MLQSDDMAIEHSMLALECASAAAVHDYESRQRDVPECVYRRTMTRTEKLWATNFVNGWKRSECCRAMTWPSSIACLRWSALLLPRCTITSRVSELCLNVSTSAL